ncbi:magnesium transporter CorA family protein [Candidatus Kuenenbacteria bacterium]|nr:magnesium transporter CorA family protein [Candidatus Kuenenbacteria bacterium]
MLSKIKELKTRHALWLDITNPDQDNLKYLRQEFGFDPSDIAECAPLLQRQKINDRQKYIFIVLQFPVYNREVGTIEPSELDIFVSKKQLIVCHDGRLKPLVDFFNLCQTDPLTRSTIEKDDALTIFFKILSKLYNYCYPIINHINLDIDNVEKQILSKAEEETIRNVLLIKRNIVNFQKTLQSHYGILQRFVESMINFNCPEGLRKEFIFLVNHTKDIWNTLVNYKDTINALHETQTSMTNLKINEIMKTLTIFSVIVFPLTLLAAVFGMNTVESMPFVESEHGFWYIVGLMLFGLCMMLLYFKRRRWI